MSAAAEGPGLGFGVAHEVGPLSRDDGPRCLSWEDGRVHRAVPRERSGPRVLFRVYRASMSVAVVTHRRGPDAPAAPLAEQLRALTAHAPLAVGVEPLPTSVAWPALGGPCAVVDHRPVDADLELLAVAVAGAHRPWTPPGPDDEIGAHLRRDEGAYVRTSRGTYRAHTRRAADGPRVEVVRLARSLGLGAIDPRPPADWVLVDVHRYRDFVDEHGHDAKEVLLLRLVRELAAAVPGAAVPIDRVAEDRYLVRARPGEGAALARAVCARVAATAIPSRPGERVRLSAALHRAPAGGVDPAPLVERLSAALPGRDAAPGVVEVG